MKAGTNIHGKRKRGRRKLLALALVLAVAILSMGTLAYTNFIQDAKNEFIGFVNHGVRIHDDYKEVYNAYETDKDIYVENYGDSPLLIRLRLDEFYRVGSTVLIGDPGAVSTDPTAGWKTYTGTLTGAHVDWRWSFGGQKYYLPTENIDDTSPDPDNVFDRISYADDGTPSTPGSATAQGPVTTTNTRPFTVGDVDSKWTNNVFPTYDLQNDGGHTPGPPYTNKTVEQTLGATVMTMKEWVDAGKNQGPFWIMDTDGWFYWGQTLQTGQATGQLLNKVTLENHALLDNYYYGINAVLQAATWDERGAFETGTDSVTGAPNTISGDAKSLLSVASGIYAFNLTATNASDAGKKFVDDQGTQWRILNINESKKQALILREQVLDSPAAMGNVAWNSAALKTTLNGTYLGSLDDDLKDRIVDQGTTLMTCQAYNNNTATASTGLNKVFLLSEYDVFGTLLRPTEATISGASQPIFADAASRIAYDKTGVARPWWTRTCSTTNNNVTYASETGAMANLLSTSNTLYIRPAMIVDLTVMPVPAPPAP